MTLSLWKPTSTTFLSLTRPSYAFLVHRSTRTMSSAPVGINLGLNRIKSLLSGLGEPQEQCAVIQVAGTNGKGTTAAYIEVLLRSALGFSAGLGETWGSNALVGRFNSPHLVEERDSTMINGSPVPKDVWVEAGAQVDKAAEIYSPQATNFERLFARALVSFTSLATDRPKVLVLEAGVGFQEDATNVFSPSNVLAGVLTQVSLDHQALLGSTLASITRTKAHVFPHSGLGILADQSSSWSSPDSQANPDSLMSLSVGPVANMNQAESEILEEVRTLALEKDVRLSRVHVPWHTLQKSQVVYANALPTNPSETVAAEEKGDQWKQPMALVPIQYGPTLFPSRGLTGTGFAAHRGEASHPGPKVSVPATIAHVTGICTALQTVWSIARDEPMDASQGGRGTDSYEQLRMSLALFLATQGSDERIRLAASQVQWPGRSDWLSIPVPLSTNDLVVEPTSKEHEQQTNTIEIDMTTHSGSTKLTTLVDGAHNPASAQALRSYLSLCLSPSPNSSPITITWIMGFTKGKDVKEMLETFFVTSQTSLNDQLDNLHLNSSTIHHKIGFVPFSQPEGMPWIQSLSPQEAQESFQSIPLEMENQVFTSLSEALLWSSKEQNHVGPKNHLTIICGSLYLVSDLYRLLRDSK